MLSFQINHVFVPHLPSSYTDISFKISEIERKTCRPEKIEAKAM